VLTPCRELQYSLKNGTIYFTSPGKDMDVSILKRCWAKAQDLKSDTGEEHVPAVQDTWQELNQIPLSKKSDNAYLALILSAKSSS